MPIHACQRMLVGLVLLLVLVGGMCLGRAAASPLPVADAGQIYLPLLVSGTRVSSLQFATAVTEENQPVNPATAFPSGTDRLYATTVIAGAVGQELRFVWTLPAGENPRQLEQIGTIQSPTVNYYNRLCRVRTGTNECTGSPLPAGDYVAQVFLNGVLYQEATATVQAQL